MFTINAAGIGDEPIFARLTTLEMLSVYRLLASATETLRVKYALADISREDFMDVHDDCHGLAVRALLTLAHRMQVDGQPSEFLMNMPPREEWTDESMTLLF